MKYCSVLIGLLLSVVLTPVYAAEGKSGIVTYDIPQKALYTHHNDDFTVRVREPGGEWLDLYEYNVRVDLDNPQNASMVTFDMSGPVEVSVKKNNGHVSDVTVRPIAKGVKAELDGQTATFTLQKPQKLSIEFDGDRLHNLHLFANAVETERPDPEGADVIWFGPGVHVTPEGTDGRFVIPSNKTVYIAGGALLQGTLQLKNVSNVTVKGHGIIDNPERGFEVLFSDNITIDGPTVVNPTHYTVFCGQSNNVRINNLKTFSADSWSDGIDMMSCSDVVVSDVFLRTSDDSVAVYGHRWEYYGDVSNVQVLDSTLWADIAHPIHIGIHGTAESPEVIENLHFKNIDVLEHDEDDRNYQGVMAISAGDENLVRNVIFEDIRVEKIQEGMLFNIRSVYNEKYSHAPGRGVRDVVFKNVVFPGHDANPSVLEGYSAESTVEGITFEGVVVGGRNLEKDDIEIRDHVKSVTVN